MLPLILFCNCHCNFYENKKNQTGGIRQDWCHEDELCIMNTWFQKRDEKLWTWRRADGIIKNQTDFILIQKRISNAILAIKSRSNTDCGSDQNPVSAKIRLRLKVIQERRKH